MLLNFKLNVSINKIILLTYYKMDSGIDFLPRSIPKFLEENNEEVIFQEGMESRDKFHKFYKKHIEEVVVTNLKQSLSKIENKTSSSTFIAGSRAWNHYMKNECKDDIYIPQLSPLETNSILPGNYDIFCVCTDKRQIDDIYKEICICFDKIIEKLYDNSEVFSTYALTYISNVGKDVDKDVNIRNKQKISSHKFYTKHLEQYCPLNTDFSNDGCIFPACKAMHLELTYDPSSKKNKKTNKEFDKKVVLYFEVIYIPSQDALSIINEQLVSNCKSEQLKFLNLTGLYLFNELIIQRNKEYDVDHYRKKILERILNNSKIEPINMYLKLITLYKKLFYTTSDYTFKLSVLLKHFIELCSPDLLTKLSSNITELLRPFINTCIYDIHLSLDSFDNQYIFITGGDAYRRYIDDIKRTNDIDTKVIYKNPNDKKRVIKLLTTKLSELVAVLYSNKNYIFNGINQNTINLGNEHMIIDVKFKSVYSIKDDEEHSAGQFRLRFIDKEDLTLFSIDYRLKLYIFISVGDLKINTSINHDIPILDVVLFQSDLERTFTVKYSNSLPIASSKYLQRDLRNIYTEINKNLQLRFHKSVKDKQRFTSLIKYLKKTNELLSQTGNVRLKRKIEDIIPEYIIDDMSKKRKEEDIIMKDVFKDEDFYDMGVELTDNNVIIDIRNFINYKKIYENTLDVRFLLDLYGKSLVKYNNHVKRYADLLLNKIKENESLDPSVRVEKLQLSFNDILDIFKEDTKMDDYTELLSKLTL